MRDAEFERLYAEHAPGLFSFLAYRTGDRILAEDLVADTFERVFRARRRFDPRKGREKAWVYAIAMNLLRDGARRRRTEEQVLERVGAGAEGGHSPHGEVDARDEVQRALQVLSPEERDVIALRFGGELTAPEIARVIDQSLTTTEGRLYRALRKLRDELG
ncbi:MAG TPA: sigma-70 family RNA polymerase sigma factor [Solirubrobacteraceae bacterium]|nr:sigma-70 family RNA polymerase sigma factor [Solirubrobacteraceae bacterium]